MKTPERPENRRNEPSSTGFGAEPRRRVSRVRFVEWHGGWEFGGFMDELFVREKSRPYVEVGVTYVIP